MSLICPSYRRVFSFWFVVQLLRCYWKVVVQANYAVPIWEKLHILLQFSASWDHVVVIEWVRYRLDVQGIVVRFPARARNICLFQGLQVGSAADPASYLVGTWAPSRGVNRSEREVDHSPQSSIELKNEWSYTSSSTYSFTVWTGTAFSVLCARSNCFLLLPNLLQSCVFLRFQRL